jgi:hypothetical protein
MKAGEGSKTPFSATPFSKMTDKKKLGSWKSMMGKILVMAVRFFS